MKICVVGIGYVGLANALLLAKNNEVIMLDIDKHKVGLINDRISPIKDRMMARYLKRSKICASLDKNYAFCNASYIIICIPTDYDESIQTFDTRAFENLMLDILRYNQDCTIIIKSTVTIGYTTYLRTRFSYKDIVFCPEFLREKYALYDSLYPSRIVIGTTLAHGKQIAKLFTKGCTKIPPLLFVSSEEAEAIKLFSNAYLAMRVGFFNELDSFARARKLNTRDIIYGVCLDPRIKNDYNNPSFGYGGYCLPKDSLALLSSFKDLPNALICAIIKTNELRKKGIIEELLATKASVIGFYRLDIKGNLILDLIHALSKHKEILIYEPQIKAKCFHSYNIEASFKKFIDKAELIVANRMDKKLYPYSSKVYTKDVNYV